MLLDSHAVKAQGSNLGYHLAPKRHIVLAAAVGEMSLAQVQLLPTERARLRSLACLWWERITSQAPLAALNLRATSKVELEVYVAATDVIGCELQAKVGEDSIRWARVLNRNVGAIIGTRFGEEETRGGNAPRETGLFLISFALAIGLVEGNLRAIVLGLGQRWTEHERERCRCQYSAP